MDDQRIEFRPSFYCKNPRDRPVVGGVSTEPIDRFGWKGDQPAGSQMLGGNLDICPCARHAAGNQDSASSPAAMKVGLSGWVTWANHTVREIRYTGMPERVMAIAKTTEVDGLLTLGERWSGFIEAPEARE